jgi:SAM-dependent methyltransferase
MDQNANSLTKEYEFRFSKSLVYRQRVWKILCNDFFARYIPKNSVVLDLGAGWGEFINNIDAIEKYALDLNADTGIRVSANVKFTQQSCAQKWPNYSESLDIVFTSNFLEHLPDKASVQSTIAEAHRCLKPGGLLICLGPNIKYVPGEYWDFWDHNIPLTELALGEVLKLCGFNIIESIPKFLPYSMSNEARLPPLIFVRLYLQMPFVWSIFGRQFLVIGRRIKL